MTSQIEMKIPTCLPSPSGRGGRTECAKRIPGKQRGFSLVAAIFLIVVVALLGTTMVILNALQRESVSVALQGARAYHAARTGVEAGLFLAASASGPGSCVNSTYNLSVTGLNGFSVAATCSESAHREHGTDYRVFVIAATASAGTFGSPDYVERMLQITATNVSAP